MARAPEKVDSVYDFLYADRARIALFLSQYSQYGHLTSLTRAVSSSTDRGGGVDFKIVSVETSEGSETSLHKHYDPQWLAPLTFLDQAKDMVHKDIDKAKVGSLLLVSGTLYVVNMRAFTKAFGAMSEAPATHKDNRQQRRASRKQQAPAEELDQGGLRLLSSLDQPVFAILEAGKHRMWSMLNPDYITGGASDLNLKHGLRVSGKWHMLGIVDCSPGSGDVTPSDIGRLCGGGDNEFSDGAISLWHEVRQVLGRPADCWGLTPLVIMREVV